MRTSGRPTSASRRASDSARWLPRLFDASAWISSTMTVRVVASIVAPRFRAEQHVQRFGCRDDDVRRTPAHARPLVLRRVAGAHQRADVDVGQPARSELARECRRAAPRGSSGCRSTAPSAATRRRRPSRPARPAREPFDDERVDGRQESGERLARTGRRGDQHVALLADQRPGARLRSAWAPETGRRTRRRRRGGTSGAWRYFLTSRQSAEPAGGKRD